MPKRTKTQRYPTFEGRLRVGDAVGRGAGGGSRMTDRGSTYRALDAEESARRTCSTVGCQESPRWVQTIIDHHGIRFYAGCDRCKAMYTRSVLTWPKK